MNKPFNYPEGAEQWLINLIDLRNRTNMPVREIAEKESLAEKSVSNVFLGKSKSPSVNLIRRIIHALGGSWREIFGESDAVIGGQALITLQAEYDKLKAEASDLRAENVLLKDENASLKADLDRLRLTLEHKEELLAHKEEIVTLQKKLLDVYRSSENDKYNWGL